MWSFRNIGTPPVRVLMLHFEYHDVWGLNGMIDQVRFAFWRKNFEVIDYRIPMDDSCLHLSRELKSFLKLGDAKTVLIIYYSGHGGRSPDELQLASHSSDEAATISWVAIRDQILSAERDVGIILDCCNAGAGAVPRTTIEQTRFHGHPKEVIAASSWSESTTGRMSTALVTALNNWNPNMGDSLSMETLYERIVVLLAQENSVSQPVHLDEHSRVMILGVGLIVP
ncbi:hypothetical protein M434DRAFT_32626 [Hypoxylon sp. CO27-5]|nr:hypothetical protein M434DRAFT_32626 [Hypoxylon sp. CO27-5]